MNIQEMFIRVYQIRVICINRSSRHVLLNLHRKHVGSAASEARLLIGDGRSGRRISLVGYLGPE